MKEVEKPWGWEVWWAHTDKYVGKILFVEAGGILSHQRHLVKDETLYLLSGQASVIINGKVKELEVGDAVHIPPKTWHRIASNFGCELIEVSTPEVDDVERKEDKYGRK